MNINKGLENLRILPNNLQILSEATGTLSYLGISNKSSKYYFYIYKNNINYKSYKNYLIEDVDKSLL